MMSSLPSTMLGRSVRSSSSTCTVKVKVSPSRTSVDCAVAMETVMPPRPSSIALSSSVPEKVTSAAGSVGSTGSHAGSSGSSSGSSANSPPSLVSSSSKSVGISASPAARA